MTEHHDTYFRGLRVLEMSDELGEYAGKPLADLGADVVKAEPSPRTDTARAMARTPTTSLVACSGSLRRRSRLSVPTTSSDQAALEAADEGTGTEI
jgi:crotonobetainyl-CoA:carnitine CoA-transferase CaiB-like acyl-CoA transferase